MEEFNKISAMDMFLVFRKSIQDMLKENPNATAKDVLDGLEMTQELLDIFVKRLKK
jgi:hypothetical protein